MRSRIDPPQFLYAKAKNLPEEKARTFGYGDVCTWVVLDGDSQMILSYRIGRRYLGTRTI